MIGCRRAAFEGSKSNSSVWTRLAASGRLFLFFGFALAGWAGGIPNPKVPRATKVLLVQTPPQLERENVFPKGRFTRELGDASGVSSSVYICSIVTFLKHLWQPCQKNLKFGMEVAYLEKRCESKFLCSGSKPGGATRGRRSQLFIHFLFQKLRFLDPPREKLSFCTPASFWGQKAVVSISERGSDPGGLISDVLKWLFDAS